MPYAFGNSIHAIAWCHTNPAAWIKKSTSIACRFFGGYGGRSPLDFFKAIFRIFCLCLKKIFGHRLKPFPERFLNGWGSTLAFHPYILQNAKKTRWTRLFAFWWIRRESNPRPKTTWYECLRRQLIYCSSPARRRLTGSLQGIALLLDWYRQNSQFKFTSNVTLSPRARFSLEERVAHMATAPPIEAPEGDSIRQPYELYCCRLLFKFSHYKGLASPLRLSYLTVPVETITYPYFNYKTIPQSLRDSPLYTRRAFEKAFRLIVSLLPLIRQRSWHLPHRGRHWSERLFLQSRPRFRYALTFHFSSIPLCSTQNDTFGVGRKEINPPVTSWQPPLHKAAFGKAFRLIVSLLSPHPSTKLTPSPQGEGILLSKTVFLNRKRVFSI